MGAGAQQQPTQPYAGLTNTAALWGTPQFQAPTQSAGYQQGLSQPVQARVPGYQGVDPRTLSGLGGFNPGGLGGPQVNSTYWQPQGQAPQQAFANPSQSAAGPQQQGYLMPGFAQPYGTDQGSMRKFLRSGVPYGLLSNPQTAAVSAGALQGMTRGVAAPTPQQMTGYVPVVGAKVGRYF